MATLPPFRCPLKGVLPQQWLLLWSWRGRDRRGPGHTPGALGPPGCPALRPPPCWRSRHVCALHRWRLRCSPPAPRTGSSGRPWEPPSWCRTRGLGCLSCGVNPSLPRSLSEPVRSPPLVSPSEGRRPNLFPSTWLQLVGERGSRCRLGRGRRAPRSLLCLQLFPQVPSQWQPVTQVTRSPRSSCHETPENQDPLRTLSSSSQS